MIKKVTVGELYMNIADLMEEKMKLGNGIARRLLENRSTDELLEEYWHVVEELNRLSSLKVEIEVDEEDEAKESEDTVWKLEYECRWESDNI